jgi:hypothetical protein
MAFLQKTWKDRVAEYINRRVLTKEDGTTELVSVERSEGTISQEGDAFSAANMNDLEQRIANEFSEQNKNLENFEPVLLWENQNPSSSFAEQTVNLKETLANYRFYEIVFKFSTTTNYCKTTGKIPIECDCILDNASNLNRFRTGIINSSKNGIKFNTGQIFNSYGVNSTDNTTTIPLAIYGIK